MKTLLIVHVASGVFVMILSLPLLWGKIPPNRLYGFRIGPTLDHPSIWYPVNQFAAKRLLLAGAMFVAATIGLYFLPGMTLDLYSIACSAFFLIPLGFGVFQSVRYAKSLVQKSA